MQQN
jgi:hypothetical protein